MYNHHQYLIGISGKMGHGKDLVATIIQLLTWQKNNTKYLQEKQARTGEDYLGLLPVSDADIATAAIHPDIQLALNSPRNPWQVKRFSAGVKKVASLLLGVSEERFEDQAYKETVLGPEWDLWGVKRDYGVYGPGKWFGSEAELKASVWYRREAQAFEFVVRKERTVRELLQLIGTEAMRDVIHPNVWVNALFGAWEMTTSVNSNSPNTNSESGFVGLDVLTHWPAQHWLVTDVRFPNEKQAVEDHKGVVIRVVRPGKEATSTHYSETALDQTAFEVTIINDGTVEDLVRNVRNLLTKYGVL